MDEKNFLTGFQKRKKKKHQSCILGQLLTYQRNDFSEGRFGHDATRKRKKILRGKHKILRAHQSA